jgi:pimeloyl-ACP methyl ester carboxylesterase
MPAMRRLLALLLLMASVAAVAADHLVTIDTRPGVRLGYYVMPRPGATATVVLLTGGSGGLGMKDGVPTSGNFLVRTRDDFAAAGFNVALAGKPSDRGDLDAGFRASSAHVADLRILVEKLRKDFGKPVWLVGTSLGTVSAAAAAIELDPSALAGIVLTSTLTNARRFRSVPDLSLGDIRVPVLVMHHKRDACPSCVADETDRVMSGLKRAPVKKLVLVDGGGGARGDPCEPMHYHGYIGMEKEAVAIITGWIRDPKP